VLAAHLIASEGDLPSRSSASATVSSGRPYPADQAGPKVKYGSVNYQQRRTDRIDKSRF